jgi:hypothetical protein
MLQRATPRWLRSSILSLGVSLSPTATRGTRSGHPSRSGNSSRMQLGMFRGDGGCRESLWWGFPLVRGYCGGGATGRSSSSTYRVFCTFPLASTMYKLEPWMANFTAPSGTP